MNGNNNLEFLLDNELASLNKKLDKDLRRISLFTTLSKTECLLSNVTLSSLFIYHIIKTKQGYSLIKNKKKYYFEKLSDTIPYKVDKEKLLNYKQRNFDNVSRTLRLACDNDLINANLVVASTDFGLEFLIEYEKNKDKYIIDYSKNIIMSKKDYSELYKLKEISRINQANLYKMNFMLGDLISMGINSLYLLLFPNEVLSDLAKNYNWINKHYDDIGKNMNNYYWSGDMCDCLYFGKDDYQENLVLDKISDFTENPIIDDKSNFYFDKVEKCYYYSDGNNKINFELLSDYITNDCMKKELLSQDRYGDCHRNTPKLVLGMKSDDKKKYLVNGKIKINEKDYLYHTWMEVEDIVFDYNNNLIMNKENYYKLMGAKVINRTDQDSLIKLLELIEDYDINFHPMTFGYFSQEITRDLEKNKFLLLNR